MTRYLSSEEDSSQQEGEEEGLHGLVAGDGLVAALCWTEEEPALTGVTAATTTSLYCLAVPACQWSC